MNTRHYTSIEQSKKLLELGLNPDTADMAIVKDNTYCNALSAFNGVTLCQNYNEIKDKANYIPCWSLGALLDVFPSASLDSSDDHHYRLQCMERFSEWYDSAVGACVDMIEKLYKQNVL